jgi:hypothetical protein
MKAPDFGYDMTGAYEELQTILQKSSFEKDNIIQLSVNELRGKV